MAEGTVLANDPPTDGITSFHWCRRPAIVPLTLAMMGWSACILFALGMSLDFTWRAGEAGNPPAHWPNEIAVLQSSQKPLVLVFLHPQCPCSRATLDELALAMAHTRGRFHYVAIFEHPEGRSDEWTKAELWKRAEAIPGLSLIDDDHGKLVRSVNARTSGDTVIYSPEGLLLFHGGLTPGRDHRGANPGRAFLESWSEKSSGEPVTAPVFGCPLCAAPPVTSSPQEECIRHAP
ncbi:hypothetical protein K2Y11_18585 [bacterium]|nr:hypothetical protein [bacterium]